MQRQLSTGADFSDQRSPGSDPDERLRLNALAKLAREAAWAGDRAVSVLVAYVESLVNPRTGSAYANALRHFIAFCRQRALDPLEVKMHDAEAYRSWLSRQGSSVSSQAQRMTVARSMLRYARRHADLVGDDHLRLRPDPFEDVHAPRVWDTEPDALTLPQFNTLLRAVLVATRAPHSSRSTPRRNETVEVDPLVRLRDFMLIYVSGRIGLRSIELARCTFGSLTSRRGLPRLHVDGKGDKPGLLMLPNDVLAVIELWRTVLEYVLDRAVQPGDAMFPSIGFRRVDIERCLSAGVPLRPTTTRLIGHRVKGWLAVIGVVGPRMSPHLLRHTAATLAFEHGATLMAIKEMLRHADLSMTVAYLARIVDEPSAASTWSPGVAPTRGADQEGHWGQSAVPAEMLAQGTVGALLQESRPVHGPSESSSRHERAAARRPAPSGWLRSPGMRWARDRR